jgi:heat shock protein HslJ
MKPRGRVAVVTLLSSWLLACATPPDERSLVERLPAEFAADLPCDDCVALREQLQLRPDHVFIRRQVRLENSVGAQGQPSDAVGRWLVSADGYTLLLESVEGERWRYAIDSATRLRPLSEQPAAADSVTLKRTSRLSRIEPQVTLWGYYRTGDDGQLFAACELERDLIVAGGRGVEALQQAAAAGPEALVAVEGRLLVLLATTEQPRRDGLVVSRVLQVQPEASCDMPVTNQPLLETRWELIELEGQPLAEVPGQAQPYIQFQPDGRLVGFTGCNQMMGSYRRDGSGLTISQLAATRRACPGSAVLELLFSDALNGTRRWHLLGDMLELRDGEERRLARFRATPEQP